MSVTLPPDDNLNSLRCIKFLILSKPSTASLPYELNSSSKYSNFGNSDKNSKEPVKSEIVRFVKLLLLYLLGTAPLTISVFK